MLQNQKNQIRKEVKTRLIAGVSDEDLVEFRFSEEQKRTQLQWEHSREFCYQGQMYDVVKTEIRGDSTFYWCWWDYEETELNKQLDQLVAVALESNPRRQESENRLIRFFESLFFSEPYEGTCRNISPSREAYYYVQDLYRSVLQSPPIPPPLTA